MKYIFMIAGIVLFLWGIILLFCGIFIIEIPSPKLVIGIIQNIFVMIIGVFVIIYGNLLEE